MAKKETGTVRLVIEPPKMMTASFTIRGTAPMVQAKFSHKALEMMRQKQEAGSTAKKGAAREAKDFNACFEDAQHISTEGWNGIPAAAFRAASISACRLVGFKMTLAKMSIFIEADGFDNTEGTPLVRITKGTPRYTQMPVRNATGVIDIRARPMFDPGWEAVVRVRFDAGQFTIQDVTNLMSRVGCQVGIGEGRPDSRDSAGMGWGLFEIVDNEA